MGKSLRQRSRWYVESAPEFLVFEHILAYTVSLSLSRQPELLPFHESSCYFGNTLSVACDLPRVSLSSSFPISSSRLVLFRNIVAPSPVPLFLSIAHH